MSRVLLTFLLSLAIVPAQEPQLPEGPGRDETMKLCKQCHEVARSISLRQDRDGWHTTMNKMVAFGMKSTEQEYATVLDYLSKHFPADEVPRVNVNTATAIELESGLTLRRSQAAALIAYREKNGDFKSIEDLKKVPGLDADKLDAKKDRIAF
jgi:competence protein ComEA